MNGGRRVLRRLVNHYAHNTQVHVSSSPARSERRTRSGAEKIGEAVYARFQAVSFFVCFEGNSTRRTRHFLQAEIVMERRGRT
jgi:hypothetical protein